VFSGITSNWSNSLHSVSSKGRFSAKDLTTTSKVFILSTFGSKPVTQTTIAMTFQMYKPGLSKAWKNIPFG
jgi:hypothetical protein